MRYMYAVYARDMHIRTRWYPYDVPCLLLSVGYLSYGMYTLYNPTEQNNDIIQQDIILLPM